MLACCSKRLQLGHLRAPCQYELTNASVQSLIHAPLRGCVTHVDLRGVSITTDLRALPNVTHVVTGAVPHPLGSSITKLHTLSWPTGDSLPNLRHLEFVSLNTCVAIQLQSWTNLRSLHLGAVYDVDALKLLPHLDRLHVYQLLHVMTATRRLNELTCALTIGTVWYLNAELVGLLKTLERCDTLHLGISVIDVNLLPQLTSITHLSVQYNDISFLRDMTQLHTLHVYSVQANASVFCALPHLTRLAVRVHSMQSMQPVLAHVRELQVEYMRGMPALPDFTPPACLQKLWIYRGAHDARAAWSNALFRVVIRWCPTSMMFASQFE
jgi:hypothetical protein